MALTASTMLALGTKLPNFNLLSTENQMITDKDCIDKNGILVCFICNHCPYVIHIADQLKSLSQDFISQGIAVVAINSNDAIKYPADSFEKMQEEKKQRGYPFAYLYDESQQVARDFSAECTPEFYLFDRTTSLYYRGRMDGSRPGNDTPNNGADLRAAAAAMIANQESPADQVPSMGCNIKWRN